MWIYPSCHNEWNGINYYFAQLSIQITFIWFISHYLPTLRTPQYIYPAWIQMVILDRSTSFELWVHWLKFDFLGMMEKLPKTNRQGMKFIPRIKISNVLFICIYIRHLAQILFNAHQFETEIGHRGSIHIFYISECQSERKKSLQKLCISWHVTWTLIWLMPSQVERHEKCFGIFYLCILKSLSVVYRFIIEPFLLCVSPSFFLSCSQFILSTIRLWKFHVNLESTWAWRRMELPKKGTSVCLHQ